MLPPLVLQLPHQHRLSVDVIPELKNSDNSCRNPGGISDRPWCFTSNPNIRWEYCAVPQCGETSMEPGTACRRPLALFIHFLCAIMESGLRCWFVLLHTDADKLCVSVMRSESPGLRQTPRLLPPATASSPAYSMSVIVIILTTLAAAVFLTIMVLACRRRRKQWRNRKR